MIKFAPIVLAVVATLCTPALAPGTPVIANFMNVPPSGNQQWYVIPQPGAYRYAFQASFRPTVFLHASNAAGSGVTVDDKAMSTFFNITEPVSALPGRYFISYVNGTITSPSTPVAQLKIQRPGDALFNQLWEFVPV